MYRRPSSFCTCTYLACANHVYYTVMSDCHHHVFDALQREIHVCRLISIEMRLILLERGVIPPSLDRLCNTKNWIKIVIGHLRNKDFETFRSQRFLRRKPPKKYVKTALKMSLLFEAGD